MGRRPACKVTTAVRHPPSGGLPGVPEGALIRVDREVLRTCRWHVRVRDELEQTLR